MEAVGADTPDNGGGVDVLVGNLTCQQLPEHNAKRPEYTINWFLMIKVLSC